MTPLSTLEKDRTRYRLVSPVGIDVKILNKVLANQTQYIYIDFVPGMPGSPMCEKGISTKRQRSRLCALVKEQILSSVEQNRNRPTQIQEQRQFSGIG